MELLLGILLVSHLILASITQKLINQSRILNPLQKNFNSILNWAFPFVWGIIVRSMIKPSKYQVMTKTKRKGKVGKHTDNWEDMAGDAHIVDSSK